MLLRRRNVEVALLSVVAAPAVLTRAVLAAPLGWGLPPGGHGTDLPRPSQRVGCQPPPPAHCSPPVVMGEPRGLR